MHGSEPRRVVPKQENNGATDRKLCRPTERHGQPFGVVGYYGNDFGKRVLPLIPGCP
jgi:hypothetical protein